MKKWSIGARVLQADLLFRLKMGTTQRILIGVAMNVRPSRFQEIFRLAVCDWEIA